MMFTTLPPDEIKRRREASIAAMKEHQQTEFEVWYQKKCDEDYWRLGKRCAGCDHWSSEGGMSGYCDANGILSGEEVLRSAGILGASWTPKPGFPMTHGDHVCGLFKDGFDWSTLDWEYLKSIGAIRHGKLRAKP